MLKALLARPIQAEESLSPLPPAETLPALLDQDAAEHVRGDQAATDAFLVLMSQLPTRRAWNCSAHGFLHKLLLHSGVPPLTAVTAPPAEASCIVSEEAILSQFFVDLSLLDYRMLELLPSTVAATALFLSRLTLDHLSCSPLTLTHSHGLIHTTSREALALHEGSRPFVARDPTFASQPFGHPSICSYVRTCLPEAQSFMHGVLRFWVLVTHYRDRTLLHPSEPPDFHKNLTRNYGGPTSNRGKAWMVGLVIPENKLFEATATQVGSVIMPRN